MAAPISDPLFKRLQDLRPCLAAHVRLLPQTYRGERWYVLADESSGNFMRLNAHSYSIIGRFDGRMTLGDLYQLINKTEEIFTEQEISSLVLQLDGLNALKDALPEDIRALTGSGSKSQRKSVLNPLALRFKLFDPDRFLDIALPWVLPLFSRAAAVIWILCLVLAVIIGVTQFSEIALSINRNLLAPSNLALGAAVFVVMKIIHEFAHAFSVKRWGGEVHEMGISFLVLMPVPYVDATASWAFRSKYRRAFVGAVGIFTELWIAAVALIVYVGVEPGIVRDVCLNALLIGGFSTLLVNGNPLLRFDGYYVLQDLLELPNLSSRASRYLRYLIQRYGLSIKDASSPVTGKNERRWLLSYGIAAGIYRLFILTVIALFLASKYLAAGIALVCWVLILQIIVPAVKALVFLLKDTSLSGRRMVSLARVMMVPLVIVLFASYVPIKTTTYAQGIVWLPDQAQLYSKSEGVVESVLIQEGQNIEAGTPLVKLKNPDLERRREILNAQLTELAVRQNAVQFNDRSASDVIVEEKQSVISELQLVDRQIAELVIKSQRNGVLTYSQIKTLEGRYVKQGDLLGYIVNPTDFIVRSVVPQRDIGRLRAGVQHVEVRLADNLDRIITAKITRETPAGRKSLPSRALSVVGGGRIPTDPSDAESVRTVSEVFHLDLSLPIDTISYGIGGRAYVRFDHQPQPLLKQISERLRQLVLRQLAV